MSERRDSKGCGQRPGAFTRRGDVRAKTVRLGEEEEGTFRSAIYQAELHKLEKAAKQRRELGELGLERMYGLLAKRIEDIGKQIEANFEALEKRIRGEREIGVDVEGEVTPDSQSPAVRNTPRRKGGKYQGHNNTDLLLPHSIRCRMVQPDS